MSTATKEYSDLPEAYRTPGSDLPEPYASPRENLEVVRKSDEKQVVGHDAPEVSNNQKAAGAADLAPLHEQPRSRARRRRRWIIILAVLLVILAISLGVGLGVGLSRSR